MKITELAKAADVHVDTLFKIKRGVSKPSLKLSEILEEITGISRIRWLFPDKYGDPWTELEQSTIENPVDDCPN
jgi:helix-turn-helix protein